MSNPVIISVGGGKGGVGKSTITANVGSMLIRKEFSVGFIDADLGGANLHLCLGIRRPLTGLQDYIKGTFKTLEEIAVATSLPNSWLISGASDILELANPNFAQKQKLIKNLAHLKADYIFVDLGAGSDYHVTDFFAAFPYGIIVTDGLPTSIENAYGFLKNSIVRGLTRLFAGQKNIQNRIKQFTDPKTGRGYATVAEMVDGVGKEFPEIVQPAKTWLQQRRTLLVLNMVREAEDIKVGERFAEMVRKYLSIKISYIGYMIFTPEMRVSVKKLQTLVDYSSDSNAVGCFTSITQNLIALTKGSF